MNQLRSLAVAMWSFEQDLGSFPPSASFDTAGRKLLSWRVYILPFLGQRQLYNRFRLDQPWDSEHNRKLISQMPSAYASAGGGPSERGMTRFVVPVGEGAIFSGKAGTPVSEIKDGLSHTILLVEVAPEHAVIWTQPEDWQVDSQDLWQGLLGDRESFAVAFADGSVRVIPQTIPAETLRRLLTRSDGQSVEGQY